MKFGEHLQKNIFEPWRNEYIQYDKLKHFLKERQLSFTGWMETDEDYFLEKLVSVEIDKVFEFINLNLRQIDSRLLDLQTSTGTKTEYEAELTKIGELSRFIELNNTGAQKIIKKHDKWTHIDLNQHSKIRKSFQKFKTYQFRVGQLRNDINRRSLLIDFSTDIEVLPPSKKEETPSFTTSKYWIHPDHINEVQAILLFHLQKKSENATIKPTHAVYFDNSSHFPLYSGLIQRKECAETLCFKGFGTDVFVTHNIHKNSWTNNSESITKEQFSLRPEQVDLFLNGQFPPNHIIAEHQKHDGAYATNITDSDEICNLSSSIYNLIHEKQLVPTVRCSYYHNKYISPHDPGLQVSLDTDMTFVNEQQVRTHRKWENLSKDICELVTMQDERTVQRFPFSILEVKQQDQTGNENTPEWLGQLIQGQLVHEVPFFSSYVHGVSCFYRERLPLLPWWLNELTKDIRRPDQNDSIHEIHSAQPITTFSNNNALPPPPSNGNNYPNINFNDETKDQIIDMVSSPSKEAGSQPLNRNGYSLGNEKVTDSSCTLTDDSLSRYGHHHADSTTGLLSQGAFSKSNIVSRIKNMKEQYYNNVFDDPENGQDDITMLTWLRAKLTGKDPSAPQASAQEIMPKKGRTKKKIEPKVFFANERTFINWLQFSGLMLSLSLGLINFGDSLSKSSGGLFIVIAMFMAGYSLLRFQYRSWQIRMRSNSRFDDMYGPAVLCFVLIISLIVNLALRVNQPLPTNPNLFGQDSISDSVPFTNQTTGVNVTNNVATNKHDTNVSRNQGIKNVTITPHVKPIKANEDEDEED